MSENYNYLFNRYNRYYRENIDVWERSRAACRGGKKYIQKALIRHVSEIEPEYLERLDRACYFNYPRKLAQMITNFVMASEPQRENANPEMLEDFSRTGLRVNEVVRQFSTLINIYGSAALVAEMPYFEGDVDYERKTIERLRPAIKAVPPQDVTDWAYHKDGQLDWIIIDEKFQHTHNPFAPTFNSHRRKLLTRNEQLTFEKDNTTGNVVLVSKISHNLGTVPAIYSMESDSVALGFGHTFEDVVRISDAILNNESEAQMNIIKQMFGLLVISDSFVRASRNINSSSNNANEKFSHIIARSAAIWESPDERGTSRYISPSGADNIAIQTENEKLKNELFDVAGMLISPPINQAQSASSKAWDYHQINQFLAAKVDLLEQAEKKCWNIMNKFDKTINIPNISYNREFAIADLQNSMEALIGLKDISSGALYNREIARSGLFLLEKIKKLSPERRKEILAEIENINQ